MSLKEKWLHFRKMWGSQNPRYQAHLRDYQRYHHLPKAQTNPTSRDSRLDYLIWLAIIWGAAAFFLYFFLTVNGNGDSVGSVNTDYLIGKIACAIFALLLGIVGWFWRASYRTATQSWRAFEQACQITTGTIIGKWSQASANPDGLLDYYIALRFLNLVLVKVEVTSKVFDKLSIGQTLPVRYLPAQPAFCEVQQN